MRWLLPLLLLSACAGNSVPLEDAPLAPVASVRWEHPYPYSGAEPLCFDATVTRIDGEHIRCEWQCLMFWTNTYGVGRYYVSREWIRVDANPAPQWVSGQFFPWPENQDEQSWPCEGAVAVEGRAPVSVGTPDARDFDFEGVP